LLELADRELFDGLAPDRGHDRDRELAAERALDLPAVALDRDLALLGQDAGLVQDVVARLRQLRGRGRVRRLREGERGKEEDEREGPSAERRHPPPGRGRRARRNKRSDAPAPLPRGP